MQGHPLHYLGGSTAFSLTSVDGETLYGMLVQKAVILLLTILLLKAGLGY